MIVGFTPNCNSEAKHPLKHAQCLRWFILSYLSCFLFIVLLGEMNDVILHRNKNVICRNLVSCKKRNDYIIILDKYKTNAKKPFKKTFYFDYSLNPLLGFITQLNCLWVI